MNVSIRTFISAAFAAVVATAAPAVHAGGGGGCHFHGNKPAQSETVQSCAVDRKAALVASGKIDAAWKEVRMDKIEQVDGKKGKEWKVSFKDPGAKDKSKESLYMFFTLSGNFLAANFTGQ